MKNLFILISTFIFVIGCKKDPSIITENKSNTNCEIYSTISNDTNYIPHKLNTGWSYCLSGYAGWNGGIILDTVILGKTYFTRLMQSQSSHYPFSNLDRFIVDSVGNYSCIYTSYGI